MVPHFEYFDKADENVAGIIRKSEFEDLLNVINNGAATRFAVRMLTPGLSGAAVFLISRIGPAGKLPKWVVKTSICPELIIAERDNYKTFISGTMINAPKLLNNESSRVLVMEFGGMLSEFEPVSLREGYSQSSTYALETLMSRLVATLNSIHQTTDDTVSIINRMESLENLEQRLSGLSLGADVTNRLLAAWKRVIVDQSNFPAIKSKAHGDLNAGNVLFERGDQASYPVIIDFACMLRSKDNVRYDDGFHLPFWDYAKVERDIQTRMFLKEALTEGANEEDIVSVVREVNRGTGFYSINTDPVKKMEKALFALRGAVRDRHPPAQFNGSYRVVLAYAMNSVLFRSIPDTDVDFNIQRRIAAEAAIALLEEPTTPIATASGNGERPRPLAKKVSDVALSDDERKLVERIFEFDGRCKIEAPRGEFECLWVPGVFGDMQWGWERTAVEAAASGKDRGDRNSRLRWIHVVEDLVENGVLIQLANKQNLKRRIYELTPLGQRIALFH